MDDHENLIDRKWDTGVLLTGGDLIWIEIIGSNSVLNSDLIRTEWDLLD